MRPTKPTRSLAAAMFVATLLAFCSRLSSQDVSASIPPATNSKQAALNLLKVRWEKNAINRDQSDLELEKYPNDPNVLLAYTLNQMQHRQYKDALSAARKLSRIAPQELTGGILHIWLETLSDNFEQALVAMTIWGPTLNNAKNIDNVSKEQMLRRMGRLIGYMQGPALDRVNPDLLRSAILAVTTGLAPPQLDLFNEPREEVLEKYEALTAKNLQIVDNARKQAEAEYAAQTQSLMNQNQQIDNQSQLIEPKIDELRSEGNQKLEQIRADAQPLQDELSTLDAQIDSANFDLDGLYLNLAFYNQNRRRVPARGGFVFVDPYYSNPTLLAIEIQNRQYEINRLRDRYRIVANQLATVEAEGYQIQNEYGSAIDQANAELNNLDREKRRNDRQLIKLAKGPKISTGKIGSLENRAEALKTYDPIALEAFRQNLIQQLQSP